MKGGSGPWVKENGNSINETLFSLHFGGLNLHRIAAEICAHLVQYNHLIMCKSHLIKWKAFMRVHLISLN